MPITPFFLAANFPWTFPGVLNYWDARYGVTSASERVSAWASTLKGSASLDQASGAAQPILLPYTGVNYLWLPAVNGNSATAPDSAPISITGDQVWVAYISADDWTPSAAQVIAVKDSGVGSGQRSIEFYIDTSGILHFAWSTLGGDTFIDKASSVAPTISNFAGLYVAASLDVDNGAAGNDVKFWTSPATDGVTFTQLGTTQTTAGTTSVADTTAVLQMGVLGTTAKLKGKFYKFKMYNGIPAAFGGSSGTLVFDANFTAVAEGATSFTESSSNGATVTINSTGEKPAYVVGSQMIIGDAAAYFLQSTFTLNPPYFLVEVGMEPTWASGQVSWDGKTANSFALQKITASPQMRLHDASADGATVSPTLKTWYVRAAKQSAAGAATLQLNTNAPTADTLSATAMAGLTVFADGAGTNFSSGFKKAICVGNTDISADSLNQLVLSMISQYRVSA